MNNYLFVWLQKLFKLFHELTICFFILLIIIIIILFSSDSSRFKVRTNPGWFEKIENPKLHGKIGDFSFEKTEKSEKIPPPTENGSFPLPFP